MKIKFKLGILLVIMIFSVFPMKARAAEQPLDEIQHYIIKVDMRTDGTMDITYHIEWKVLDDSSEGPLSWVKIGVPNKHVDEITAITSNIKDIKYTSEGGAYVRIDFDREYKANETIIFEYSLHQSYMYIIEEDNHLLRYSFTPGWFDEIEVKNITIKWNKNNVIESTASNTEGNYLIWEDSLDFGERLNASVKYNLDAFETNEDQQYTEDSGTDSGKVLTIILVIVVGIIVVALIVAYFSDDYGSGSGYGRSYYRSTHIYGGGRSSCACVSSCACACACAGGGRAGCSKKDFYGTKLQTDMLNEVLKEDV